MRRSRMQLASLEHTRVRTVREIFVSGGCKSAGALRFSDIKMYSGECRFKTSDFCSARRSSSEGSNPALHWAADVRETCMEFVSLLGSVFNIDCLHEIPTCSFCFNFSSLLRSFLLLVAVFVGSHRNIIKKHKIKKVNLEVDGTQNTSCGNEQSKCLLRPTKLR